MNVVVGWPHMEVVLWYLKWSFRRVRHVKLFEHLNLIQDPHVNDPWNLYWFVKLEIIWQAQAYGFEESFHDLFLNLQTFQDIRLACGVTQSHWHVGPAVKFPLRLDHCPTYVYWFVGHVWAKTWLGPCVRDIRGFNSEEDCPTHSKHKEQPPPLRLALHHSPLYSADSDHYHPTAGPSRDPI